MDRFATIRTTVLRAVVMATLIAAPAAASLGPVEASAHASPAAKPARVVKPDAQIAKGAGGIFVGDGVYNTTGANQARSGTAAPGRSVIFRIALQNDGNSAGRLRVQGAGSAAGYGVKYLSAGTDVTAAVVAGTFATGNLAVGASEVLTARVSVKSSAATGSSIARLVTVTSVGPNPVVDAVLFTAKRT